MVAGPLLPRRKSIFVRPRVLYVTYAPPVPARLGPARRHYHLLDQFARFCEVDLLSTGTRADAAAVERCFADRVRAFHFTGARRRRWRSRAHKISRTIARRCDFLPALDRDLAGLVHAVTSRRSFDAIVLSSMLLHRLPLPDGVPVVGDTHNVEFDALRRTAAAADGFLLRRYASRQWPATRREEQQAGRRVDLVLATSARDRRVFEEELGLARVAVVPNGVDLSEFAPVPTPGAPGAIVFSGLMSYYPNQQAIRWFLDAVFPLIRANVPDARLIVAGAAPPRWLLRRAGAHLEVTGLVPDIRPFLAHAQVVVTPLLIGGGTRVKILEAQAMARPVVSTTLAAEGLNLRHNHSALIADDAASFAASVVDVLRDRELAARIARNGREHAARDFDWNRIGDALRGVLASGAGVAVEPPAPMEQAARC